MSGLSATSNFAVLAASLLRKAAAIGQAQAETARLNRSAPDRAWRRADLLWPTFSKG